MKFLILTVCGALVVMAGDILPWKGSVSVNGGAPSSVKSDVFALQPGASYRLDFRMRKNKTAECTEDKTSLELWGGKNGLPCQIASFDATVPVDGEEHACATAFALPKDATGEYHLLLNGKDTACQITVRDVRLTKLPPVPPVTIGPAEVTAKVEEKQSVNLPSVIHVNLGEDGVMTLLGNEAFCYQKRELRLAPSTPYRFTLEMRKEGELSPNPIEHRGAVMVDVGSNRVIEFGYLGELVPVDGKWHSIDQIITVPPQKGTHFFCLYNCHAKGTLQIRNFTVTKCKSTMPWGSDVLTLKGSGKFLGQNFPFGVKPGQPCQLSFRMRKVSPLATETLYHRAVVAWREDNGTLHEILYLGEKIPVDGKWHEVNGTVTLPPASQGNGLFFLYNCHATGTVEIRDWKIQEK